MPVKLVLLVNFKLCHLESSALSSYMPCLFVANEVSRWNIYLKSTFDSVVVFRGTELHSWRVTIGTIQLLADQQSIWWQQGTVTSLRRATDEVLYWIEPWTSTQVSSTSTFICFYAISSGMDMPCPLSSFRDAICHLIGEGSYSTCFRRAGHLKNLPPESTLQHQE